MCSDLNSDNFSYEPRQVNLCLRAFRHDKFQLDAVHIFSFKFLQTLFLSYRRNNVSNFLLKNNFQNMF